MKVNIEVKGLKELLRLLKPAENLYAEPWRDGMEDIASETGRQARARAPRRTGGILRSIQTKVQKKPFPTWLSVRAYARNRNYPYPRLLEYSVKHGHRDWMKRAVDPVWDTAHRTLNRIGQEIAHVWERR